MTSTAVVAELLETKSKPDKTLEQIPKSLAHFLRLCKDNNMLFKKAEEAAAKLRQELATEQKNPEGWDWDVRLGAEWIQGYGEEPRPLIIVLCPQTTEKDVLEKCSNSDGKYRGMRVEFPLSPGITYEIGESTCTSVLWGNP